MNTADFMHSDRINSSLSCVNGCNRPIQPPSKVLCAVCLKELNQKFIDIATKFGIDIKDL